MFNGSYHFYIIFALLMFALGEILRNNDKLSHLSAYGVSQAFLLITYLITLRQCNEFNNDVIYALLLTGAFAYNFFTQKRAVFKYVAYLTSNLIFITAFNFLSLPGNALFYIPMITTLGIMAIESNKRNTRDKYCRTYLGFAQIVSFIYIYLSQFCESNAFELIFESNSVDNLSTIISVIFGIIIIVNDLLYKEKIWMILPLTCMIPALFNNSLNQELGLGVMLLATAISTIVSLKEKRLSTFTFFSGLYLLLTFSSLENNYIREILCAFWSIMHVMFMDSEKSKDLFKFFAYISLLFMYNSLIIDFDLSVYTVLNILGYVLLGILTIRPILSKHMQNVDLIEYITFGIIYLVAFFQYKNQYDGMLCGVLIILVLFLSYFKKYGALFMTSILAILVNIFALTRQFWFNVPWWVYLLAVGAVLLGFAIKNEADGQKGATNLIELFNKIKNKIEK